MNRQEYRDLGIGAKGAEQKGRIVNRDGSFNAERRGLTFFQSLSVYHSLLTMSWLRFNCMILGAYAAVNVLFAWIYVWIGVEHLKNANGESLGQNFLSAFFFSTQTFTTVGYGHMAPDSVLANTIASIESLVGLLAFAVATGMLFGRFARPEAKILFSERGVIAPYQDITAFMFRTANLRKSQMIEVHAEVSLSIMENVDGAKKRRFYSLELERESVNFFHLSWTVVHPIDEKSPLYRMSWEAIKAGEPEFVVLITGFDDSFSQTVHTRTSYLWNEIEYNRKFAQIIYLAETGASAADLDRISQTEPV